MARNRTGRGGEGLVFGVLGSVGLKIQETSGDVAMVGAGSGVSSRATERDRIQLGTDQRHPAGVIE